MEIDKNPGIQVDAYVNQVHDKNKAGPTADQSDKAAPKTDTVVISDAAKRIQEARAQLDQISDVREDKVAELKKQIESGSYKVDSEQIAEKMLKDGFLNDV